MAEPNDENALTTATTHHLEARIDETIIYLDQSFAGGHIKLPIYEGAIARLMGWNRDAKPQVRS